MIFPCFEYQLLTSGSFAESFCNSEAMTATMRWLLEGKIPETFVVVPSEQQIVVTPTAKNRYIEKVTVTPIPSTTSTDSTSASSTSSAEAAS